MVAAAAGMATVGKIPFVYTAGAFLVYRALEFIRDDICFQNLNVKIVGMGSGLAWSSLGPTHHTTEDIAILRAIPNLMILSPATPKQVAEAVELAYKHKGPVYIRIGMNKETEFFAPVFVAGS
jgi:transketolase